MIIPEYEEYLIKTVLPLLDKGRPGFNLEHTKLVIKYVKILCDLDQDLDREVLLITAYLHDYGYIFFSEQASPGVPNPSQEVKDEHPAKSLEYWQSIQEEQVFDFLSEEQKERIGHLILVHDELAKLQNKDELIFMEADTLGALGTDGGRKIESERYQKYLERVQLRRIDRFITDYSKTEARFFLKDLLRL